jgi:peptidoglycan hydrolase-like protein with peptidoglycan-binding domain
MSRLRPSHPDQPASQSPSRAGRVIRRLVVLGVCATIAGGVALELRHSSTAAADPSAHDWYRLRVCESGNNYRINTGNDHYGAYQFDLPTWRSVGGRGYPNQASAAEQDARALMLYRMRGWQPWQCAAIVGLREDRDARSGRIGDITVAGGGGSASPTPRRSNAWPGVYYSLGDNSAGIRQWQLQMRARGAPLVGTGRFGQHTLAVVNAVQLQNGLRVTGLLGPNTWALAWNGRYQPGGGTPPAAAPRPAPKPAPKPTPKPAPKPAPKPVPAKVSAPAWTAPQYYSLGDDSATIKAWQQQMRTRGAPLRVSGQFGTNTLAVVNAVQQQNHLNVTGLLGPVTWTLAWTGSYRTPPAVPPLSAQQYFSFGDTNAAIKAWQLQMRSRGAALTGSGQFGPRTLAVVKRVQQVNHLEVTGVLGPETWKMAWLGAY